MNALADKKNHLLSLVGAIERMEHTPFPFLCAATMVEYLIQISGYGSNYDNFICDHFPASYVNFRYVGGQDDLPKQMRYILRNGLVHTFSLFPDAIGQRKGARNRSILITHRAANEGSHLSNVRKISCGMAVDAALFVLEDFCNDIAEVIRKIFTEAATDPRKAQKINDRWIRSPPATWIGHIEHPT
jgi:hypothetical protein